MANPPLPAAPLPAPPATVPAGDARAPLVRAQALPASGPQAATAGEGGVLLNLDGAPLAVAVKTILGGMLGQSYTIAPGVGGTVTIGSSHPLSMGQAIALLEQALVQNNARMLYRDGRYDIVPAYRGAARGLAPDGTSPGTAAGYRLQIVSLQHVSARQMRTVLQPYARRDAIVAIDETRNLITLGGSADELANYLHTVALFDVDWLKDMAVEVFPLVSARASALVPQLQQLLGQDQAAPSMGTTRFVPLDSANALLVFALHPEDLTRVRDWLERIDAPGDQARLFSYPLRYLDAATLASSLGQVVDAQHLREGDGTPPAADGGISTMGKPGAQMRVSALKDTNALAVWTSPQAWQDLRQVLEKLDVAPTQIRIDVQIAQLDLADAHRSDLQWYVGKSAVQGLLQQAAASSGLPDLADLELPDRWSLVSGTLGTPSDTGLTLALAKRDAAAIINALQQAGTARVLVQPSVMVRNDARARFNVGLNIPTASVAINASSQAAPYVQAGYRATGTILQVRPRASADGTVLLEIEQEVSYPAGRPDAYGNIRIDTRRLKTEAALVDGQTMVVAALTDDDLQDGSSGAPGLVRPSWFGRLFGTKATQRQRHEVLFLITPSIVRDGQLPQDRMDQDHRRFQSLLPLHVPQAAGTRPPAHGH